MNDVIVLPLLQSSLPVAPSSAYTTAGTDFCARCAAVIFASLVRNSPLDTANTTPLITSGVNGDTMSREAHPGSSVPESVSFHATIAPLVTVPFAASLASAETAPALGARIQRVPAASCHVESAPAMKSSALE